LCFLNLQMLFKKESYGETKFTSRNQTILRKVLINLLQGYYWTSMSDVKNVLGRFIYDQEEVDQILSQITVYDEQNHKIRIKDEYEGKFDQYLFYRVPSIRQELIETVVDKDKKSHKVDLVSGVYYSDLPQHLLEIQKNFYQGGLVDFLSLFIRTFNPQTSSLLPSILKLILLNLQILENRKSIEEDEVILKKVQENYMTTEFKNHLNELLLSGNHKECEACIQNIQGLMKSLSARLCENLEVPIEEVIQASPSKEEEKKRLAKERMEKMKMNFMMKQAQFSEKNQELIKTEESKESSPEALFHKNKICQYCMEEVHDSGDEYGLLAYITFINNFYPTCADDSFKEQDYSDLAQVDWWPVVSSCNHYYHKKCFETLEKIPKGNIKDYFYNEKESFCRLCKSLCNTFLPINPRIKTPEKEVEKENDEKVESKVEVQVQDQENGEVVIESLLDALLGVEQEKQAPDPEPVLSFVEKIENILLDVRKKLLCDVKNEKEDKTFSLAEMIFTRGYSYFVEGFHLQSNPKTLSKMFEVYTCFFKAFEQTSQPRDFDLISQFMNEKSELQNVDDLALKVSARILQEIIAVDALQRNSLNAQQITLIKDYILLKLIELLQTDDSIELYENYHTILKQIVFPMQKIVLATQLNKNVAFDLSFKSSELFKLLLNPPQSNEEEYLTNLLNIIGISLSFDQFIQEIVLSELPKRSENQLQFFNTFSKKNNYQVAVIKKSPRTIKLPETYAEFNSKYFPKKCGLCDQYSQHLCTVVCLICGDVMCTAYCEKGNPGNLNRHARKYHMGMSLFIDIQQLHFTLINSPHNVTSSQISPYIDKLGQSVLSVMDSYGNIRVKELDFKQFAISKDYEKAVKEFIGSQTIRKEVFNLGIKFGKVYRDGFQ